MSLWNNTADLMRQTTVRFGEDLWAELEREAEAVGVSVAQYLREAALTRLVYERARHGDESYETALRWAGASTKGADAGTEPVRRARRASEEVTATVANSQAVWAQARQARARASELRRRYART